MSKGKGGRARLANLFRVPHRSSGQPAPGPPRNRP